MTEDRYGFGVIPKPDEKMRALAAQRWDSLAKPIDGLGRFEEIICRAAAAQGKSEPALTQKALVIMCADNGVVAEGVSQTDASVTRQVAELMGEGRSSVGIMTRDYPLDVFVYDVGIDCTDTLKGVIDRKIRRGTGNIAVEEAMSRQECMAAIQVGIDAAYELKKQGYDIIATGEMGIGNTTTSTALYCALLDLDPELYTGRGAGLTDEGLARKIRVIRQAVERYRGLFIDSDFESDPVHDPDSVHAVDFPECLRQLGGLDIAALSGVFIGGAQCGIPVVIDGLISAVASYVAECLAPGCKEYMIASHIGREKGMEVLLQKLSLEPVIHGDMALGEGTGAVMLFPLLDMAMNLFSQGTAFDQTPIDQYERYEV